MKLYGYLITLSSIVLLSFTKQHNAIHKRWKLVAEEISHLNFDYTKQEGSRDRLDSIKNETVQFLPDGSFKSGDGDGTYIVTKDSIHVNLNGKKRNFKYTLHHSKLVLETYIKDSRRIVRSRLYLE